MDMSDLGAVAPPHSDEAEQGVLGAVLMDNAVWDKVGTVLTAEAFYRADHRAIWSTLGRLIGANKPADVITVFEAGGHELPYLGQLVASVPSQAAARRYAEIVAEHAMRRELMRLGAGLADEACRGGCDADAGGVSELVDRVVTRLMQLGRGPDGRRDPRRVSDLCVAFLDHVSALAEGKSDAISTGLTDLDDLTAGGIRPGELWVIGARPSMGKTAFTGHLVRHMAKMRPALFLSQEDSYMALVSRHVAALGRVNLADLRRPDRAPDSMWGGMADAVDELRGLPLYLDDQAGLTLADVRRKIQATRRDAGGLGVVVVDYLQLMMGQGDNRNIELGKIANGLKQAAKDFGVGLLLLSQMNREAEKRAGPPQMSDLRDSGDIEGAADLIGLLHREYKRNPTEANKHYAELHVVKQKNGATDTVRLYFDGAHQRFDDWRGPAPTKSFKAQREAAGGLD